MTPAGEDIFTQLGAMSMLMLFSDFVVDVDIEVDIVVGCS